MARDEEALRADCAPTFCATPSTMPPTSVPHSEPAPPITAASKAKISCGAPA